MNSPGKRLISSLMMIWLSLPLSHLAAQPAALHTPGEDRHLINELVIAVDRNRLEDAKKIIAEGADVDDLDSHGMSPLMMAVIRNRPEMAQLLLDNGAHPELPVATGLIPLQFASSPATPCSVLLLDRFLRNSPQGYGYLTVLVLQRKTALLQTALSLGLNPNTAENNGVTPLMAAVYTRQPSAARILLAAGADPNATDPSGNSARTLALRLLSQNPDSEWASLFPPQTPPPVQPAQPSPAFSNPPYWLH